MKSNYILTTKVYFLTKKNRLESKQYKNYPETFEYGKFYFKCKTCIEIIENKFGRILTPR